MKIYNKEKTKELIKENLDMERGYLIPDKLFITHHESVEAQEAVYKDRIVEEEGGGISIHKDLVFPAIEAKEAYDEYEDIQVFVPYTAEEIRTHKLTELRRRREQECFPIINRGQIWYDSLTVEEREALKAWYMAWLNVTETLAVPEPISLSKKTKFSDNVTLVEELRNTVGYY